MKTPEEEVKKYSEEINKLNEDLFVKSKKAADFGAIIIFWSEANGVFCEEDREDFMKKAQDFARENHVYFAPTVLVLKYDTFTAENKILSSRFIPWYHPLIFIVCALVARVAHDLQRRNALRIHVYFYQWMKQ